MFGTRPWLTPTAFGQMSLRPQLPWSSFGFGSLLTKLTATLKLNLLLLLLPTIPMKIQALLLEPLGRDRGSKYLHRHRL
mgnify:CR=1 FL=1